jgi:hypothetical protein
MYGYNTDKGGKPFLLSYKSRKAGSLLPTRKSAREEDVREGAGSDPLHKPHEVDGRLIAGQLWLILVAC